MLSFLDEINFPIKFWIDVMMEWEAKCLVQFIQVFILLRWYLTPRRVSTTPLSLITWQVMLTVFICWNLSMPLAWRGQRITSEGKIAGYTSANWIFPTSKPLKNSLTNDSLLHNYNWDYILQRSSFPTEVFPVPSIASYFQHSFTPRTPHDLDNDADEGWTGYYSWNLLRLVLIE